MNYKKTKYGYCWKCGIKLPVPTWNRCMMHDGSNRSEAFIDIKPPAQTIPLPAEVLDEKKYKPFDIYMGYTICIPFEFFINAKELIVDQEKWTIIGWR